MPHFPAMSSKEPGRNLGTKTSLREWTGHPRYKWRVTWVSQGAYRSKGFAKKKDAVAFADAKQEELTEAGNAGHISHEERQAVIDLRPRLAACGVSLRAAIIAGAERAEAESSSVTVDRLIELTIDSRRQTGHAARYIATMEAVGRKLSAAFGGRSFASLGIEEFETWLHALDLSPVSVNSILTYSNVIFNEGVRLGFRPVNPMMSIRRVKVVGRDSVGTITPAQLRALLANAGPMTAAVAISAFAGVRRAEVEAMDWSDVDCDSGLVTVRAENAKSARFRMIPMEPPLLAWLTPIRQARGPIWPTNGRKLLEAAKRSAGFGPDRPWPGNALRHSYASYWLAVHKDPSQLALHLGHTSNELIFAHYRRPVPEAVARGWWAVMP